MRIFKPTRIKKYREPDGEWHEPDADSYFLQSDNGNYLLYCRKSDNEEYRRVDMYFVREIIWDLDYKEPIEYGKLPA